MCRITAATSSARVDPHRRAVPARRGSRTTGTRRCRPPAPGRRASPGVSRVSPMSRMLFTPAETTATSVVDSSVRSALTSKDCCAPRCTPPRPPVTKTRIPASAASRMVEATVVAPCPPRAIDVRQVAEADLGRRRRCWPSSSRSSSPSPTRGRPSQDGDGRGHGAEVADDALDLAGHLDVLRVGHAVADDRALQRHDRVAVAQRRGHLVGELAGPGGGSCRAPPSSAPLEQVRGQVGADGVRHWRRSARRPRGRAGRPSSGASAGEHAVAERREHRVAGAGHVGDRTGHGGQAGGLAVAAAEQRAVAAQADPHAADAVLVQVRQRVDEPASTSRARR